MKGAEILVRTLLEQGVDTYFTNPGTSEMQFVTALDRVDGVAAHLALFEGVATGAADGYARMKGKPAATLLHLGPGVGNGWANLHNAKKANTPLINIVGDHAIDHVALDAPLTADIEGVAGPVSKFVRTSSAMDELTADAIAAYEAAMSGQKGISTLIMPADLAWTDGEMGTPPAPILTPPTQVEESAIDDAAKALRHDNAAILANGAALTDEGLNLLGRIAEATGCRLISDTFTWRTSRGAGRVPIERLQYFAEAALEQLQGISHLVLVGTKAPVSFFAYPDVPSLLVPQGCKAVSLSTPAEDTLGALEALAEAVAADSNVHNAQARVVPDMPEGGAIDPVKVWQIMARMMPEGAILAEEAATSSFGADMFLGGAAPFEHLQLTGGSIGYGLPVAVGAAVACPDRKVICPHGDGGAMYTIQSLWSMARDNLDVTTVIFANRSYAILNIELMRVGAENPGRKALDMLDIGRPDLNFVKIAQGMGVEASRATTAEEFAAQFESAMNQRGPRLIEVVL